MTSVTDEPDAPVLAVVGRRTLVGVGRAVRTFARWLIKRIVVACVFVYAFCRAFPRGMLRSTVHLTVLGTVVLITERVGGMPATVFLFLVGVPVYEWLQRRWKNRQPP